MDIYGAPTSAPENYFRIDDLLDFSNEEIFSSSAASTSSSSLAADLHHISPPENSSVHQCYPSSDLNFNPAFSIDFTDHFSVPSDDVAELEWLSRFVDDSFTDFPANALAGVVNGRSNSSFPIKPRGKRTKSAVPNVSSSTWITSPVENLYPATAAGRTKSKKEIGRESSPVEAEGGVRRCTHCASEKTPQWRTGPLGPKTLCNACGVRFKSGRLVPEYRPAASPTFVLTQHSNSHRKVMELRRQKELLMGQQQHKIKDEEQFFQQNFEVC